jgi:uncharacterized protein YjbJ (UPF0337 family)
MTTTWHQIAGSWKQFSGKIKKRWGDLTHDEHMKHKGQRKILAGSIQERFGVTPLKARNQLNERDGSQNT